MTSVVKLLTDKKLLPSPPRWLADNTHYEVITGSVAYGVSSDTSDMDVYGWCIPPKQVIFPHLEGTIVGFGPSPAPFNQYQEHHIKCQPKEYDVSIYNIVRYFHLCWECNPNMIDTLFVPEECVLHATVIAQMVRERRKLFLSKAAWHKFKGYAYSQLKKSKLNDKDVKGIRDFESDHNIDHSTTLENVEQEMRNRGIIS